MGVLVVVTATSMYGRITSFIPRESTASSPRADRDAGGEEGGGGEDGGQGAGGGDVASCSLLRAGLADHRWSGPGGGNRQPVGVGARSQLS
jgi:hypothetical protein